MRKDWEIKKLGDVCEILDSLRKPITKSKRINGIYPYYGASGVQDYIDSYIFDGRFLLIGEDGAKWGKKETSSYIIEGKSWVNNHVHVLKLNEYLLDSFVEYYLNYSDLNKYITGAVVPKLTQRALQGIMIPVPPFQTQQQIVEELDSLTLIIGKQKKQLEELDNLAQSIFYDMFGDPIENEKGWKKKSLGTLCEVSSAKRVLVKDVVSEGVPFIRGTELAILSKQCFFDKSIFSMFITPEHYEKVKAITGVPEINDLLIPSINPYGYVWKINTTEPIYFKDGRVIWIHTNHSIYNGDCLRHILVYEILEKYSKLSGAVFAELTLEFLRTLKIIVPPLPLQQQFAAKIEAIEKQKELIKKSIKETEDLFNSRMDYYFN